jgi:hypothetical protein
MMMSRHRRCSDLLYAIERTEEDDVLDTFQDLCEVYDLIGELPSGKRLAAQLSQ